MRQKSTAKDHWNRRTTRYEPPVLEEAITAAQSLTDEIESQTEIAAKLMGLSEDEVRPAVLKASRRQVAVSEKTRPERVKPRVVVIERRSPRKIMR